MATNAAGIYYPLASDVANPSTHIKDAADSLLGRTVPNFASTGTRDTYAAALTSDQKRGAVVFVTGKGWQGFDGSSWVNFSRTKFGAYNGVAEGNNMFRVLATDCFFDGAAPSSIICMWTGPDGYVCSFGQFDGSGALIKVFNFNSGSQLTSGASGAFYWIACR